MSAPSETQKVKYLREHSQDPCDSTICRWLEGYLGTSYRRWVRDPQKEWVSIQPGWPGKQVLGYSLRTNPEGCSRSRIWILLMSGEVIDIGASKFKQYLRSSDLKVL